MLGKCAICLTALLLSATTLLAASPPLSLADAVEEMDRDAIQALLDQRTDVNATQPDGMTALHWAAYRDNLETAKLLLKAGADVKARNRYGVTPLSLACTNGNAEMVKLFLDAGADANATLSGGETALMSAARTGNVLVGNTLTLNEAGFFDLSGGQNVLVSNDIVDNGGNAINLADASPVIARTFTRFNGDAGMFLFADSFPTLVESGLGHDSAGGLAPDDGVELHFGNGTNRGVTMRGSLVVDEEPAFQTWLSEQPTFAQLMAETGPPPPPAAAGDQPSPAKSAN